MTTPTLQLTDERRAFVDSIRDFCRRECGTREQRDRLTGGGEHAHSQELYERMAELGWLGVAVPEEYGGSGAGAVDMCLLLDELAYGSAPVAGIGTTFIVAGAYERFGTEEQKQDILGGIVRGAVEAIAMSEPESGSDVGSMRCRIERRNGTYVAERAQDLDLERPHLRAHPAHRPHHPWRDQARGPHDGQRARRRRRDGAAPDRHDGRPRGERRLLHRLRAAGRCAHRPRGPRLDPADGGPERGAADPRRTGARPGAPRVRGHAQVRDRAPAVRPPDRLVPGAEAPALGPRDRDRVHAPAGLRRRRTGRGRSRPRCSRARRRWRSSRRPRPPSG